MGLAAKRRHAIARGVSPWIGTKQEFLAPKGRHRGQRSAALSGLTGSLLICTRGSRPWLLHSAAPRLMQAYMKSIMNDPEITLAVESAMNRLKLAEDYCDMFDRLV